MIKVQKNDGALIVQDTQSMDTLVKFGTVYFSRLYVQMHVYVQYMLFSGHNCMCLHVHAEVI